MRWRWEHCSVAGNGPNIKKSNVINTSSPYFNIPTHNKNTADMVFQGGSSSVLATAGHSQDGRNVAIWDTLLPARKACVQSFR